MAVCNLLGSKAWPCSSNSSGKKRAHKQAPTKLEENRRFNIRVCKRSTHFSTHVARASPVAKASPHGSPGETTETKLEPEPPSKEGDIASAEDLALAFSPLSRRAFAGLIAAFGVPLGGNLGGITSLLLGFNVELSRSLKLDVVYPIDGFKRCLEKNFEFLYPATWVGDQRLLYRAAERAEKQRLYGEQGSLNPSIASLIEPVVAFGPPGSSGELNVSVIVAPVPRDFRLDKIGDPKETGEVILKSFVRNSKVLPTLLYAEKNEDFMNGERLLYYNLEFLVQGQSFLRHNVSVYVAYNGQLFSMNAQTPEDLWTDVKKQFSEMANSFKVRP